MDTSNFLKTSDFDQFNGTLISRVMMEKDYIGLERDLDAIIKGKIEDRKNRAREEWKEMMRREEE